MRWTRRWSKRLRALLRRDQVERELDEELAFHLEMETQKNLRAGMSPAEARRRAAIAFGGVQQRREEVRDARWLGWLSGVSLDARLGARMLVKHPALTLVGGLGMAVAIAIGAVFEASTSAALSPLPLEEGDRLVALEVWDAEINNQEWRIAHDLAVWRAELRSVGELAAYRTDTRTLWVPGGSAEPVSMAEMTASAFAIARVPPLLGRPLVEEDERPGAPKVAVLSHDLWLSRFGGDPEAVGREVRLGSGLHTVVGVMPEGFGLPVNQSLWVPLRLDPAAIPPREGAALGVLGRLAPGATLEDARAELDLLGRRAAAASPETHRHLRPRAIPYGPHLLDDMEGFEVPLLRALILLLLTVICVNVAALVYARTATRSGEITVRSALGASRRRIVTQFFAEALVLAGLAAAAGLALAAFALGRIEATLDPLLAVQGGLPFWVELRLTGRTVLWAAGMSVVAAGIVGVVPALQATGPRLQSRLRALGGSTGMRLGRTWTVLIVAQVAFAVAVLPVTLRYASEFFRFGRVDPGFPAEEYLGGYFTLDGSPSAEEEAAEPAPVEAGYAQRMEELRGRLETDPGVLATAFSARLPEEEAGGRVEVEGAPAGGTSARPGHRVKVNRVDAAWFEVVETPVLHGRGFTAADAQGEDFAVVVNRSFVRRLLGDANPVGRRLRYLEGYRAGGMMPAPLGVELEREYEIVGVVDDLMPEPMDEGDPMAQVFHPLPVDYYPVSVTVRTRGAPAAFVPRLRDLAAGVDPALELREPRSLEAVVRQMQGPMRIGALALGLMMGSVLLLSAAGIYALMSFTVTRRRREIGIRCALGARPGRILTGIFARAAAQLGLGTAVGLCVASLLHAAAPRDMLGEAAPVVLPGVVALMLTVGLLAALGPARRGLRIQPMEALRED